MNMPNEIEEKDELLEKFEETAKRLDEVLEDLRWRKPDVEREERILAALKRKAKKDPTVEWQSQAIVVRVARAVLQDKIAEAERLERQLMEYKEAIEFREASKKKAKRGRRRGKAVQKT